MGVLVRACGVCAGGTDCCFVVDITHCDFSSDGNDDVKFFFGGDHVARETE